MNNLNQNEIMVLNYILQNATIPVNYSQLYLSMVCKLNQLIRENTSADVNRDEQTNFH